MAKKLLIVGSAGKVKRGFGKMAINPNKWGSGGGRVGGMLIAEKRLQTYVKVDRQVFTTKTKKILSPKKN